VRDSREIIVEQIIRHVSHKHFCSDLRLFGGDIGLFGGNIGLFCEDVRVCEGLTRNQRGANPKGCVR